MPHPSRTPHRLAMALALVTGLAACDAGHLGNPLTLPVRGAAAAAENAQYDARRAEVKAQLVANEDTIRAALPACAPTPETCPNLPAIMSGIPPELRTKVATEIRDIPQGADWAEQATVIVMVHNRR